MKNLSGMQLRNLEEATGVRVIDRTILILDIFALRGLFQKKESFKSNWLSLNTDCQGSQDLENPLSRLGGGIGTRGHGRKEAGN